MYCVNRCCCDFFGFVFVYENLNVSKKSLFVSGSAVLSEKDNKRFYGSKTFDKIAYEYECNKDYQRRL